MSVEIENCHLLRKGLLCPMPSKKKETKLDSTIEAANITSRRSLIGVVSTAALALIGVILATFIKPSATTDTPINKDIYRVRVTVIDPQGKPVVDPLGRPPEDLKVWVNVSAAPQPAPGGWQFDIASAIKPKDGKLTFRASKETAYLMGQTDINLNDDYHPAVTIQLKHDDSAKVRGQVVDRNNRAIAGARVFIVGFENDSVTTKEGGNFELPAHAAVGQMVNLHAEKPGYQAIRQEHPAGDHPATLVLEK